MSEAVWSEHEVVLANHPYMELPCVSASPECVAA